MLFRIMAYLKRWWNQYKYPFVERRQTSVEGRNQWEETRREREAIERRLNYLETQADVYARKDL